MKKFAVTFAVIGVCSLVYAEPWAHRYDGTGGQSFSVTSVQNGATLTFSAEWNQPTWVASDIGWGTSSTGVGWQWQDCPWFQDGNGNDKRCRTDVTFSVNGLQYYAFRLTYGAGTFYLYGNQSGWMDIGGQTTLSPTSASTVNVVPEAGALAGLLGAAAWLLRRR